MRNRSTLRVAVATAILLFWRPGVSEWVAEDSDKEWTMPVKGTWIGGSYYQIADALAETPRTGGMDEVLRLAREEARDSDAILVHLEFVRRADGLIGDGSFIRIKTTKLTEGGAFPSIDELTTERWMTLRTRILSSTAGAVDVELIRHQEDIEIQGNRIATAGFKILMESGDHVYEGNIFIYRPGAVTSFNLQAPLEVAGLRLLEMWMMVRAIEFAD